MRLLVTGGAGYIGSVSAGQELGRDHAADVAGAAGDQEPHDSRLAP